MAAWSAFFLALISCFATVQGLPSVNHSAPAPTAQVSSIYDFPHGTWLENISQRPNGLILTTQVNPARLWQVDPSLASKQTATLVAEFPQKLALLGLVEYAPDVFAVIGGNISLTTFTSDAGSYSIFGVDFRTTPASISLLADVPGAKLLNGLTFVPPSASAPKGILLAADSILGVIWSLRLDTSKVEIAVQDDLMAPCGATVLGINGLKYDSWNKQAYFTNTYCQDGYFASVPIDASTGKATGPASIVGGVPQRTLPDDFALAPQSGVAYVAYDGYNEVGAINLTSGHSEVIVGNTTTEVTNPSSVFIGRTAQDRSKGRLYASTGAGQVVKIDVGRW